MCNLHDVSWGNRPADTGTSAFTANKEKQKNSDDDYKVFRTNFVFGWLLANMLYYVMILELVELDSYKFEETRDSDDGYLAYFSIFLASMVFVRLLFSSLFILKWKCRYCCSPSYKVARRNLDMVTEKLR